MARAFDLLRLPMAIADPRRQSVREVLELLAQSPALTPAIVAEAILQSIPYSGIPGAVEALGFWREIVGWKAPAAGDRADPAEWRRRGEEVFAQIYDPMSAAVRDQLRARHPLLEEWVIEFAYGRVMGRGEMELATVEALGVASLLAQERRAPLHSHIRGALRAGWTKADLLAAIGALAQWCSPEISDFAREVVARERI